MNKNLSKILATLSATVVLGTMSGTIVNANEIDFNTTSETTNSSIKPLDDYDQIYLNLFANKDINQINQSIIDDCVQYLSQGFHQEHMLKINQAILSKLLQNIEQNPFTKGIKANQITNELSYQSKRYADLFITRIDLDGQGSTLTYSTNNYKNLWIMKYCTDEKTRSNDTYHFIISEINNRHLNLAYNKKSKTLTVYYHTTAKINQYIFYYLNSDEQGLTLLRTMVDAMNRHDSIDDFLSSDIIVEIDSSHQLSNIVQSEKEQGPKIRQKK